jgi:hypothetical protein
VVHANAGWAQGQHLPELLAVISKKIDETMGFRSKVAYAETTRQ